MVGLVGLEALLFFNVVLSFRFSSLSDLFYECYTMLYLLFSREQSRQKSDPAETVSNSSGEGREIE